MSAQFSARLGWIWRRAQCAKLLNLTSNTSRSTLWDTSPGSQFELRKRDSPLRGIVGTMPDPGGTMTDQQGSVAHKSVGTSGRWHRLGRQRAGVAGYGVWRAGVAGYGVWRTRMG